MKPPVRALRAILALNVVVTFAAMFVAYRALHHADDSERLVIRSHQTLQAAEETLRRVVDAETWERAFLLTRDAADLQAFKSALQTSAAPMDSLAAMLREDGRGAEAEQMREQIVATLRTWEQRVERMRASAGTDEAERARARAGMEAVRDTMRGIRQAENDVLGARIRADAAAGRWVTWLAIVMTGLATTLTTTLIAALIYLARPGAW